MIGNEQFPSLNFGLGGYTHQQINYNRTFYGYDFFSLSGNMPVLSDWFTIIVSGS